MLDHIWSGDAYSFNALAENSAPKVKQPGFYFRKFGHSRVRKYRSYRSHRSYCYSRHIFSNLVNSLRNASSIVPVGPLRCLPTINSAFPWFSSVGL